jgi:hypothetical protein
MVISSRNTPRMTVGDGGSMPGMTVATHLTRVAPAGEPDSVRLPADLQALIATAIVPVVEIPGFRRGMTVGADGIPEC